MRLGLIGCGSIGGAVVKAITAGCLPGLELVGIADPLGTDAAATVAAAVNCPFFTAVPSLLDLQPDLVLEAASADAVRSFAIDIFECGADLMIVSVGALADAEFFGRLIELAKQMNRRLHIPSGAIGGLDIIKAAVFGGLEECRLTTTKPPRALSGVPYVHQQGLHLENIRQPTMIFEGTASQAVLLFPQRRAVLRQAQHERGGFTAPKSAPVRPRAPALRAPPRTRRPRPGPRSNRPPTSSRAATRTARSPALRPRA